MPDTIPAELKTALADGFTALKTDLSAQIDEKLAAQKTSIDGALAQVTEKQGKLERAALRVDAEGRQFRWFEGDVEKSGAAPSFLRGGQTNDSKPLMISNLWRATLYGASNPAYGYACATEELAFSERLKKAGYTTVTGGGALFPLGDELILEPVNQKGEKEGDFSELRKEIRQRLALPAIDPGEVGWLAKRYPEIARNFGLTQKDLQLGSDVLGGYLVPTTQGDRIIDLLRNRLGVMRAGATEFPLPPTGNLTLPRLTADPDFAYADPDSTTDMSTSNINLGVVRLVAKSVRGAVTIPNDLMRYSSPAVEMIVRAALAAKFAVAEDSQFLEGVGSSIAPKGLIHYTMSAAETPTIGKVTLHVAETSGAQGDTFGPTDPAEILGLYYTGNDPDPPTAWIMRPMKYAHIRNLRADAVTAGDAKGPFMFNTGRDLNGPVTTQLEGVPVVQTVQVSKNRTEGTATDLTYIFLGNFRRMLIGRVGVLELAVSEHVKFLQDKTIIRAVGRNDMGLEHEESFVFTDTLIENG